MMFRRAPMAYLAKPDLIKEFFEELGFRLILTSPHVPPVILLHAGAFYMHFTDYEDEAERELILKLCSAPGLCSSKFKEPCYLSLLCNHLQLPITVTFYRTKTTAIALSLEEYNRRAKDNLKITEEEIRKVAEANLLGQASENE